MNKYVVCNCPCLRNDNRCGEYEGLIFYCQDRESSGEDACTIKRVIESRDFFITEPVVEEKDFVL